MRVIRAADMGMCFGVRDALAATASVPDPTQVTIHGELVHNPAVARRLADAGFQQPGEAGRHAPADTPVVLITAHGVSDAERGRLARTGTALIDTTCPLVRKAHEAALELRAEGRHVVVIGAPDHVEVQGLVGDLDRYDVVAEPDAVRRYASRRLGVVCQTTMPDEVVERVLARLRELHPGSDIRVADTVCQPTRARQRALGDLLEQVEAVVVVGGRNSNNTRRLVGLCQTRRIPAFQVEQAGDLDPGWFETVETVGLTAGTSTLDETIDAVQAALEGLPRRHARGRA